MVTNETGVYQFPSLQPGSYTVSAAAAGFQTATYNDPQRGQNQPVRLNFSMQLAAGAQSVEVVVEADTALATTATSEGEVLAANDVLSQVQASRNVLDLVAQR